MKNYILFCVSVLFSLLLVEGSIRLWGTQQPPAVIESSLTNVFKGMTDKTSWGELDPELGWVNKEGNQFVSSEPGNNRVTNWDGYRRASAPEDNSDNTKELIWIIGDSWTAGVGVADKDTYPWRLNTHLGKDVFVENYGTPGYSTYQAYLLFNRLLSSAKDKQLPSIVILGFTSYMSRRDISFWSNEVGLWDFKNGVRRRPPFLLAQNETGFERSPMWLTEPWLFENQSQAIALMHSAFIRGYSQIYSNQIVAGNENTFEGQSYFLTEKIIKQFHDQAIATGTRFILATLQRDSLPPYKVMIDNLASYGVEIVNCEKSGYDLTYLNGGLPNMHPNGKYHTYFTNCIAQYLALNIKTQQ